MTFAQAAEEHLDDVYGYLAWFTADRCAAEDLDRRDVRAGAAALAPLRSRPRARPAPGSARSRERSRSTTSAPSGGAPGASSSQRRPSAIDARFAEGLSPELESALGRLTPGEREVVALRVLLDLDAGARRPHARHLAHQLHDAPQPRAQEARGGTPCRSVTSSRSCAPRASTAPPELRERVRLIAADDRARRRAGSPGAARSSSPCRSPRRSRPRSSSRGRPTSPPQIARCPARPRRSRTAPHRHGSRRARRARRRAPSAKAFAVPHTSTTRVQRYGAYARPARADAGRASRTPSSARSRSPASLGGYPVLGARADRTARPATPTSCSKVPRAHVQRGGHAALGARHDHRRAGRRPGPAGRAQRDRPH